MSGRIVAIATRLVVMPLRRPWGHDVTTNTLIAVDVTTDTGATGHGFSWTPTVGGTSVRAFLDDELAPRALGMPADPAIWDELWAAIHEAGGGGITSIALAGIDLALWDLQGRQEGRSVIDLIGRRHDSQPAYGSGINRHLPLEGLVAQVERFVEAGFDTVKVKVGGRPLADDLARVAAVRSVIGPERRLTLDANQLWDLPTAQEAARALARFDVAWLEEPLRADDTAGYTVLRRHAPMPIALGENTHTWFRFRDLLDAGPATSPSRTSCVSGASRRTCASSSCVASGAWRRIPICCWTSRRSSRWRLPRSSGWRSSRTPRSKPTAPSPHPRGCS